MKTLRITATGVTESQHSALIQTLRDAGIRQEQLTVATGTGKASGPALWLALVLTVAAIAGLLAWIWTAEWRYAATAGVLLTIALFAYGASINHTEAK